MSDKPVLRDEEGHILPGSAPLAPTGAVAVRARRARYLDLMDQAITDDDITAIVRKAVEDAKEGNRFAREWLWNYCMGKPTVMPGFGDREAPFFKLMRTWLMAKHVAGELQIDQLTGTFSLPVEVEPEEE